MPRSEKLTTIVDNALRRLEKTLDVQAADLQGEFIDPGSEDFDPNEQDLQENDEIVFALPRCEDDGITLTYGELDAFVSEIVSSVLIGNLECWTSKQYLIRIEHTGSYESYLKLEALQNRDGPLQTITIGDCNYEISLDSGTTPFGFMILKSGNWDRYFPPVLVDDLFIRIRWSGSHDKEVIPRLVDALIFELSSSLTVLLRRSPRTDYEFDEHSHDSQAAVLRELRPVLNGEGLSDALNLYSLAIATDDPGFQIIGFVKVLEHIAATVVREELISAVRSKLFSSRALDPNAEFIVELETIIIAHARQTRKDSDALRLTIQKCCDATELAQYAPKHLLLRTVSVSTKDKDRITALNEFSSSVSATRNQIVHAKLNYEKTGEECPMTEIQSLANACRVAAEQAVRWFALQHESVRVIRNLS